MTDAPSTRPRQVEATVEPLVDCPLPRVLALPYLPLAVAVATITGAYTVRFGTDPGLPPQFANLPLGVGGVVALVVLRRMGGGVWDASAVFRRPSVEELGAAVVATVGGIGIATLLNRLAPTAGLAPHGPGVVETPLGLAALVFGSVLVAPVAEEVLFRGLLFGHLAGRGHGFLVAAGLSALLFGLNHVFVAGIASVVVTGALGVLLVGLRIRYDNLVGAWLMHLLTNVWGVLVALSVLPAPW